MTTNNFALGNELAVRDQVRKPGWAVQAASIWSGPPDDASDGVALLESPRSLVAVQLRTVSHARTAIVSISSFTAGETFTLTINGNTLAYDSTGDASADAAYTDMAAAINADGTLSAIVTATNAGDGGLTLTGNTPDDFNIGFTGDGSAVIKILADAAHAVVLGYFLLDTQTGKTAPTPWFTDPDAHAAIRSPRANQVLRWKTGGYLKGHAFVAQLAGVPGDVGVTLNDPVVTWGPGLTES